MFIFFQIPVQHTSPTFNSDYSILSETPIFNLASIYEYNGLITSRCPDSFTGLTFLTRSFNISQLSPENFDEQSSSSNPNPQSTRSLHFSERESHSTSGFEMTESCSTESIVGLSNRLDESDEFYPELSSADWLYHLANLLTRIWEELDMNVSVFDEIMPCVAQNGEITSTLLWTYIHDVQVFIAEAMKI
nr:hypothetical protein HmN_000553600 [Hymenolepis microstoma]